MEKRYCEISTIELQNSENVVTVDGNQGDLNNASLWYNADELIKTVTANNNNTIVVLLPLVLLIFNSSLRMKMLLLY